MPSFTDTLHRSHVHRAYRPENRSPIGVTRLMERRSPTHVEIAELAYSLWEARGRQHGTAQEDWLRAERLLKQRYDR
jgi:hypothetical protein